jgi:hypothetical protein
MPDDNRVVLPGFSGQITLSPNTSLSAEIHSCTRITQPDGSIVETVLMNEHKVTCWSCNKTFRNQAMLVDHRQHFEFPCKVCNKSWNWCHTGVDGYERVPYCPYTCVQHGVCFTTGEAAQDHGLRQYHKRCYYPRCTNKLATGVWHEWYIYQHVQKDHCQGN